MPYRFVPALCVVALLAAFAIDMTTPQLFVAAILLDVPIVLSSLAGSRAFRLQLIVAALVANAIAGYANGLHDQEHWDAIAIGDRMLAALSIVLVGYLSATVREGAERAGRAASADTRVRREVAIGAAVERIRSSLSMELVERAVVQESRILYDAREARFAVLGATTSTLIAERGRNDVDLDEQRLPPEAVSLVQRTLDEGEPALIRRSDALARLILDTFETDEIVTIPIVDRERRFGVVFVIEPSPERIDDALGVARTYAVQAANALAQARLFEQLAERNSALEERNAVIRDLVYALSHDLRTPLAALGMTLQQARAGAYGALPPTYLDIVDQSIIATDDVGRLAETLLLVARFESGERRPERGPVDLATVMAQIAGELAAMAHDRKIELRTSATDAPLIVADRSDVRRAILNLAANALDHTPAGGTVAMIVEHEAATVVVRIVDDGYGLSERARSHLFGRFARGDDRGGGGSGLGLYIARRVAEESGGTIAYEPNMPRGSIFTIRLPALGSR